MLHRILTFSFKIQFLETSSGQHFSISKLRLVEGKSELNKCGHPVVLKREKLIILLHLSQKTFFYDSVFPFQIN